MKEKLLLPLALSIGIASCRPEPELEKPNILWVSVEDISPLLGCYGDPNAFTPHLDAFAERSVLFSNAFATHPACSPSRSCIITGKNAVSLGTQHLRSEINLPDFIKPFPKYLREAGYYATNNSKEDYNFIDTTIWDESSSRAHWRDRKEAQPFFSVFNLMPTHQSMIFGNDAQYENRIRKFLPHIELTSPESLVLPPYYPDTPEIRKMWARYYTNVTIIDHMFSEILKELEADGLANSTIVVFFSDHGTGVPRGKRSLYDAGMRVPLMVYIPNAYADRFGMKMGTVDNRVVNFADFAPSMLEIAGMDIPDYMQGKPFINNKSGDQFSYVFGASDRVDEGFEMARTIRTQKYRYIRNFMPHLPLIQPNHYTDQSEIMQEIHRVKGEPLITETQSVLYKPRRTAEELYDIENDPHEVKNLAYDSEYNGIVKEMREKLRKEIIRHHDTGLMPEPEMLRLSAGRTPHEISLAPGIMPLEEILDVCDLMLEPSYNKHDILRNLRHPNGLVRFWTVITVQEKEIDDEEIIREMRRLLDDSFFTVQLEAANTLVKLGDHSPVKTMARHLQSGDDALALYAARSFQQIHHLLDNIPDEFFRHYKKLEAGLQRGESLRMYTYWALANVFDNEKYNSVLMSVQRLENLRKQFSESNQGITGQ